jgi:hypothetical protein
VHTIALLMGGKRCVTWNMRISEDEQVMLRLIAAARGLSEASLVRTLLYEAHLVWQERKEAARRLVATPELPVAARSPRPTTPR